MSVDLPAQRSEAFFRVYKDLPEGRKEVELNGFLGARKALEMVSPAIRAYQKNC